MSNEITSKINRLLYSYPPGIVYMTNWLAKQGYSLGLQSRYRQSGWFKTIGTGAMIRTGENVGYEGALYALQAQASKSIHPGGKTALALLGKSHYLQMGNPSVFLFGDAKEYLPTWFRNHD